MPTGSISQEEFLSTLDTPDSPGLGIIDAPRQGVISANEFESLLDAPDQDRPPPALQAASSSVQSVSGMMQLPELTEEDLGGGVQSFALQNNPDVNSQLRILDEHFPGLVSIEGNNLLVNIQNPDGSSTRKILNAPGFSPNDVSLLPVGAVQVLAGVLSGGLASAVSIPVRSAILRLAGKAAGVGFRGLSEMASGVAADEAISHFAEQDTPGLETLDERFSEQIIGEGATLLGKVSKSLISVPRRFATEFRTLDQVNAERAAERINQIAGAPGPRSFIDRLLDRNPGDRIELSLGEATNRPEVATVENISANQPSFLLGGGDRARKEATERVVKKARDNVATPSTRTEAQAGADAAKIVSDVAGESRSAMKRAALDTEISLRVEALQTIAKEADINTMVLSKAQAGRLIQRKLESVKDQIRKTDAENFSHEADLIDQIVSENPNVTGKVDVSSLTKLAKDLIDELPTDASGNKVILDDVDSLVAGKLKELDPRQTLNQLRALRKQLRAKADEIAGVTGSRRERALSKFESAISQSIEGFVEELAETGKRSAPGTIEAFREAHTIARDTFKSNRQRLTDQGLNRLLAKDSGSFVVGDVELVESLLTKPDRFRAAMDLFDSPADKRALKAMTIAAVAEQAKFDLTSELGDASRFIRGINSLDSSIKSQLLSPDDAIAFQKMATTLEASKSLQKLSANTPININDVVAIVEEAPGKSADFIGKLIKAKNVQAKNHTNEIFSRFRNGDFAVVDDLRADEFIHQLIPNTKNAKDLAEFMDLIKSRDPQLATDIQSLVFERTFTSARQRMVAAATDAAQEIAVDGSAIRGIKPSEIRNKLPASSDIMKNIGGPEGAAKLREILSPEQFQLLSDTTQFLMNQENVRRLGGEQAGQLAAQNLSFKVLTELKGGMTSAKIKLMGRLFGDANFVRLLIKAEAKSDSHLRAVLRAFSGAALRQAIGKTAFAGGRQATAMAQLVAMQEIEEDLGAPTPRTRELVEELQD